jgi:hypothetical protein
MLRLRPLSIDDMPDLIEIPSSDSPEGAGARFKHEADVIFLIFGSLESALSLQVRSTFARALVPVALYANALLIDNGSNDGLAALLGQAAQQVDKSPTLLGILPSGVAEPDPNHTSVMLLPAQWPDPAKSSFLITASLAESKSTVKKQVIALLVGGGDPDKLTALRCARRGWPLLIMKGAGGHGDAVLSAKNSVETGTPLEKIADPDIREIVDTGTIRAIQLDGDTDGLKRVLLGPIQKPGDIVADAWSRYDDMDLEAVDKQDLFRLTQIAILAMTVVATLMAIMVTVVKPFDNLADHPRMHQLNVALHILMIIIPITISLLVGFNARFREGNKWILLRASAESIKQHIFRYRARSGTYSEDQCTAISAPTRLASNMRDITSNLVRSEVNRTNVPQRNVQKENRTNFLTPEEYIRDRVEDQIKYFVGKTQRLYRQLKRLQFCILFIGGLGTFLAAINRDVWVALTTALATAFTSKLELDQVENSLVQYNTALTSLRNIQSWWKGLSPWERSRQRNIDLLVDQTETTLEHEMAGWVEKMQSTLEKLTEKESSTDQNSDAGKKA